MEFVSERIVNIHELEEMITNAKAKINILVHEIEKAEPSNEMLMDTATEALKLLETAESFEFCIEKRKCYFKASSENPR